MTQLCSVVNAHVLPCWRTKALVFAGKCHSGGVATPRRSRGLRPNVAVLEKKDELRIYPRKYGQTDSREPAF